MMGRGRNGGVEGEKRFRDPNGSAGKRQGLRNGDGPLTVPDWSGTGKVRLGRSLAGGVHAVPWRPQTGDAPDGGGLGPLGVVQPL